VKICYHLKPEKRIQYHMHCTRCSPPHPYTTTVADAGCWMRVSVMMKKDNHHHQHGRCTMYIKTNLYLCELVEKAIKFLHSKKKSNPPTQHSRVHPNTPPSSKNVLTRFQLMLCRGKKLILFFCCLLLSVFFSFLEN
jgi:hypothetical protein